MLYGPCDASSNCESFIEWLGLFNDSFYIGHKCLIVEIAKTLVNAYIDSWDNYSARVKKKISTTKVADSALHSLWNQFHFFYRLLANCDSIKYICECVVIARHVQPQVHFGSTIAMIKKIVWLGELCLLRRSFFILGVSVSVCLLSQ